MAASDKPERYDFIIFGATGFTGQYCVEEMIRTSELNSHLTWAIAGRNEKKLKEVLQKCNLLTNYNSSEVPVIIADVSDVASLGEMCRQAKVVLNCVGPYRFYGEAVVKACVENGTHHIDISGEPQFLENTQLNYHELAKEAGVYIIGSCGYDSIPCEIGLKYLRDLFPGDICYAETFAQFHHGPKGTRVNFGTWQSAIYGFAHANELKPLRQKLFKERLPKSKYAPPAKKMFFYSNDVDGWCVPFPAADKPVVVRTQHHLLAEHRIRPFHVNTYLRLDSLYKTLAAILGAMIFALFASFSYGRKLLETYPAIISFGMFTKEGPTRAQIKDSSFTTTSIGYGYEFKLEDPKTDHTLPPDIKLVVKVKGPDAGYVTTPICMIQAGMVVLEEEENLPGRGGVYTPGGAFENTTLMDRLKNKGFVFIPGNPIKINVS